MTSVLVQAPHDPTEARRCSVVVHATRDPLVAARILQLLATQRVAAEHVEIEFVGVGRGGVRALRGRPTATPLSRVTLVIRAARRDEIERLTKMINRIVDVVKVQVLTIEA